MWKVGQKIGDYELVAHLSDGGMASLFLARRLGAAGFSRDVAIKIVHPELASDPQFRTMFLDEALLSSRIQHPNVGHVEEFGEVDGTNYLVMEFVHGCSLAQLQRALIARGRRLAPAFAARIAMHVLEGLHAAHETCDEQGRRLEVVHRDVSPENILLAYAGHVKLIDFGIAKAFGRRHRTEDGLLKGKFRYMSPEQASAKPIDRRTDVYQLGIVLWEMLTLRRLFNAETDVDLLAQVRAPRIPPPSSLVDRISPALDAVVMSALDPNPARRPPDARTFARRLAKAVPTAHEVDSGALSSLLLAMMSEQRREQKKSYPSELFQLLEQQVPTQREAPEVAGPQNPAFKAYTLENTTSPYGSDAPEAGAKAVSKRHRGQTELAHAAAGAAPGRGAEPRNAFVRAVRPRRLVRLASELRDKLSDLGTTITALARLPYPPGKLLAAFSLGALSLMILGLLLGLLFKDPEPAAHARPAPPSALPAAPLRTPRAQAITSNSEPLVLTPIRRLPPEEQPAPSATPDLSGPAAQQVEAGGSAREHNTDAKAAASPKPSAPRQERAPHEDSRRGAGRLAAPVPIDGTPLIPDPGF